MIVDITGRLPLWPNPTKRTHKKYDRILAKNILSVLHAQSTDQKNTVNSDCKVNNDIQR